MLSSITVINVVTQVLRLLPGGMDVLGIFAMAPPDMMKAAQVKLRQVKYF